MVNKKLANKKVIRRGAEPIKPKKPARKIPWKAVPWRSLSLTISICSVLYAIHLWKAQWQIDEVVIRGELAVFEAKDIAKELLWLKRENFFDVNVDEIKQSLIEMPLIADARVKKVWPASIEVLVLEAKPLAIWNDTKLLSSDGQLSELPNKALPQLSRMSGAERHAHYAVAVYPKIQAQLNEHELSIKVLNVSDLGAFDVQLEGGEKIKFGRKQLAQRLSRLDKLLQKLDAKSIQSIDLRYGKGAAVLFKQQGQIQEKKG